ncbi:Asx homology domain-containing protein [Hypoxylon sp. FL1284]|nr:Asx homology domain-containing protein [Hypoxylon sp. FL1284]
MVRGKNNAATEPSDLPRRTTRASTKVKPALEGPSPDDSASQGPSGSADSGREDVADKITVCATNAQSHTSSRPSTANSDAASQRSRRRASLANEVDPGDTDELASEAPARKKSKPVIKNVTVTFRKSRSKFDNPDEMLTNPRAPLAKTKLRDLLCSPQAWDLLSPVEQQRVLALFPDEKEVVGAAEASAPQRPDVAALRNNDDFRHDAAQYQDALAKGWHDPEWIRDARHAHEKRCLGAYDEYLADQFEEDWGTEVPETVPEPASCHDGEKKGASSGSARGRDEQPVLRGVEGREGQVKQEQEIDPDAMRVSDDDNGGGDNGDGGNAQESKEGEEDEKGYPQTHLEQEGDSKVEDRAPDPMQGVESATAAETDIRDTYNV